MTPSLGTDKPAPKFCDYILSAEAFKKQDRDSTARGTGASLSRGRGEETLRSTIECLPEVVKACAGKVPVLIDGGVRRGTDIFKALALGANSVGVGCPPCWGLAAFGQPGVEAVLTILRREVEGIMRQAGTTSIAKITRESVVERWR